MPTRIGPYEVSSELGRGAMGVVFRAKGPDGRAVALKLLRKPDPTSVARFERERRLLGELTAGEGFVALLDAGSTPDGSWFVMPLLAGGTLRERLRRGPLSVAETVALGRRLATALGRAHAKGIVHRDLKPENILFAPDGTALVADLGIAKHFDRHAPGASQSVSLSGHGDMVGTAGYMAPEQVADAKTVGPPADVFALGAILHECLTGRPAFDGPSLLAVVAAVSSGEVEPLSSARPDAPGWLAGAIARALSVGPDDRQADGDELARSLAAPDGTRRVVVPAVIGVALGVATIVGTMAAVKLFFVPAPRAKTVGAEPVGPEPRSAPAAPVTASDVRSLAFSIMAGADRKAKERDIRGAITDATAAIAADPTFVVAWINRGRWRAGAGELEGARADFDRALALDPLEVTAWTNRGLVKCEQRDFAGALADLDRAIALGPGLAVTWAERGRTRERAGDLVGAISDLDRAIELDPGYALAWANRGVARSRSGDSPGALADLGRALELDPRLVDARTNRGHGRLASGDYDGAISDYTAALDLEPRRAGAWGGRGQARAKLGDLDGGIADLTKCLELEPRMSSGWVSRGFARRDKGDIEGAIADLEQFARLQPDQAAVAREEIAKLRARKAQR